MLDRLVANAGQYIHTNPWLALVAVFLGGIITASNPCALAMVPLMMSFVAGRKDEKASLGRASLYSFVFILGLALTFTALGMVAALAGKMYGDVSGIWNWIVAIVCVLMGLHLAGVIAVPIPSLGDKIQPKARGYVGALLLGLLSVLSLRHAPDPFLSFCSLTWQARALRLHGAHCYCWCML
jgi:cytochrome c biogenesis protein CcdA